MRNVLSLERKSSKKIERHRFLPSMDDTKKGAVKLGEGKYSQDFDATSK